MRIDGGGVNAAFGKTVAQEAGLKTGAAGASPARTAANKKLEDGAHEFEAMMLGQMLKGLSFGGAPGEDPEDSEAGAAGTIRSFGTEAVAKAISAGGGFGLARQMVRQVEAERDATHGANVENSGGTKVR